MYRFPWYLMLVSTNHASSNPDLTGKSATAFLAGRSWQVLKSWYTTGAQKSDLGAVFQMD